MLAQLLGGNPFGAFLFLVIVSSLVAWFVSGNIQKRYIKAIENHQKNIQASPQWPDQSLNTRPIAFNPLDLSAQVYLEFQAHKEKAILLSYGLAGAVHALIATIFQLLVYQSTITPFKIFILSFVFVWPLLITIWLLISASKKLMLQSAIGYAVLLIIMAFWAGLQFWGLLFIWLGTMAVPTLILLFLSQRALQSIGHFVFPVVLLISLGINIAISFLVLGWGVLTGLLFGLFLITGITWLSWQGIQLSIQRCIAREYSERMLLIDAWWLTFTLWEAFIFSSSSSLGIGVLLAFIGYKVVLQYFLQQFLSSEKNPPLRLLWLRVFGRPSQSTAILDAIGNKWRNIGSIQMIAGADLASTFLEPHQLLEFWRGRLRYQFIQSPEQVAEQMNNIGLAPASDGRYRITQFFCLNDNWRFIFNTLLRVSNTVLMDLRGFTEINQGVRYELETLFNCVPAQGFVIIVDAPFSENQRIILREIWNNVNRISPNFERSFSELKIIEYTSSGVQEIIKSLYLACRQL